MENIGIFTKMESRSLIDHLSNGRSWDLNRKIERLRVFNYTEKNLNLDDIQNFSKNILYFQSSNVINSIIGDGCSIYGTIENSIIFRRVTVSKGSALKNCIVLQNCIVDNNVKLEYTILDKNVHIKTDKELKGDKDAPM